MPQAAKNRRDYYAKLGRLVYALRPELVDELLMGARPSDPEETDLGKMAYYYHRFCSLNSIDPEEYTGYLRISEKNNRRKVFIAAILHLYCPDIYQSRKPKAFKVWNTGLSKSLADLFQISESSMCYLIKRVVSWQHYDDFREEVEKAVNGLQGHGTPLTQAVSDLLEGRGGKRQVA